MIGQTQQRRATIAPSDRRLAMLDALVAMLSANEDQPSVAKAAELMGCNRANIYQIRRRARPVTDRTLAMMIDGLRDLSMRAERLADMAERELTGTKETA